MPWLSRLKAAIDLKSLPGGWGCRVIARDHAKRRTSGKLGEGAALTEMNYLVGVDDVGRVGALRFRNATGEFMRTPDDCEGGIPPLLELTEIVGAAHAVERGTETEEAVPAVRGTRGPRAAAFR
jgi:serine/threonine-protein kinase HipA